jgi:hypothetical protein
MNVQTLEILFRAARVFSADLIVSLGLTPKLKRPLIRTVAWMLLAFAAASPSIAQKGATSQILPAKSLQYMPLRSKHGLEMLSKLATARHTTLQALSSVRIGTPGVDTVINWSDRFYAAGYDSNGNPQTVWPYTMVGLPPELGQTTVINVPIVPVIVQFLDPKGNVVVTLAPDQNLIEQALNSPLFQPAAYTSGTGQFNDQQFRAQFWDRITGGQSQGNNWHTLLHPSLKQARVIRVPAFRADGSYAWWQYQDDNGHLVLAAIDEDTFFNLFFPSTSPVTNATPVGAAELAGDMTTADITTFLFGNVALLENDDPSQCCILGFHTYDFEPGDARNGNRQRNYMTIFTSWLSVGAFAPGFTDMLPWSHEMVETFNDPFATNWTPWWTNSDYYTGLTICQNNLEGGDVIEVQTTLLTASIALNGMTYHPQNVALLPFFEFQSPSRAHLGAYSFPDETALVAVSPGPLLPGCVPAP